MPRPSNSPPPSDAKIKAVSTEMTYYRRRDWVWWSRSSAVVAGLLIASAWGAWILQSEAGRVVASPGRLSRPHDSFHHQCDQCHTPFHPVRDDTAAPWVGAWVPGGDKWTADAMDGKCKVCHRSAAEHHTHQLPAGIGHCAACHSEHHGHDFDPTACDDRTCTSCHENLDPDHLDKTIRKERITTAAADHIDSFLANSAYPHQEFPKVSTKKDLGCLKFTHGQHMTPGIPRLPGKDAVCNPLDPAQQGKFVLANLAEADRSRYRDEGQLEGNDATNAVRLECAHCHQADSDLPTGRQAVVTVTGPSPLFGGRYMAPVTYENNCQACHPLNLPTAAAQGPGGPGIIPADKVTKIPHGRQPAELKKLIRDALAGQLLHDPRGEPAPPVHPAKTAPTEQVDPAQQLDQAQNDVWSILLLECNGCVECHSLEHDAAGKKAGGEEDEHQEVERLRKLRIEAPEKLSELTIAPTDVKRVWMPSARFDHFAHRTENCNSCHAGAETSNDHSALMLPGIAKCRECHTEFYTDKAGKLHGGVAWNCTECHRYHAGYDPLDPVQRPHPDVVPTATLNDPSFHALLRTP